MLKRLVDFLMEIKKEYPDTKVDGNGRLTYANGNDGTVFDWSINSHLCEIGWGVEDGSRWAFKCFVYKTGLVKCYCYPHGEVDPVKVVEKNLFTVKEAQKLYKFFVHNFDQKYFWDKTFDHSFIYDHNGEKKLYSFAEER